MKIWLHDTKNVGIESMMLSQKLKNCSRKSSPNYKYKERCDKQ